MLLVEYITILGVEIPIWILLMSLNLCFIFVVDALHSSNGTAFRER